MKFNQYTIIARVFPAVLSFIPFYILYFFLLRDKIGDFISGLLSIQWLSDVTVSVVLIFLLIQICRFVSKEIYEKNIYSDGLNLPTTNYLLHLDSFYTPDFTRKIHQKILSDFNIQVPPIKKEILDEIGSRKSIKEAVNLIRIKVSDADLVLQYNAEYGFIRNVIGGSIIAFLVSIVNSALFYWFYFSKTALVLSLFFGAIYFLVLLSGKRLMIFFGNNYARALIQEYVSR